MATPSEYVDQLKATANAYVARDRGGAKLLTLSYSPRRGCFRFFTGPRPGGGGRKHTRCDEVRALELLAQFPGGGLDRR